MTAEQTNEFFGINIKHAHHAILRADCEQITFAMVNCEFDGRLRFDHVDFVQFVKVPKLLFCVDFDQQFF